MKKLFVLAMGLLIAFSFWGTNAAESLNQTVPVTVAHISTSSSLLSVVPIEDSLLRVRPTSGAASAAAPIPTRVAGASIAGNPAVASPEETAEQQRLAAFIERVAITGTDEPAGVYVPGHFELPVVQQPDGNNAYVSEQDGTVTQFRQAGNYGTVGLLAHNFLAGRYFFDLQTGDTIILVQGDGDQEVYMVMEIQRYQALTPNSVYSDFIDLANPSGGAMTAGQVFRQVYTESSRLVMQTCIESEGDPSWGRHFVIAVRIS